MAHDAMVAIVTGATRGLGLETARQLASRGWRIGLTGRDVERGQRAVDALKASGAIASFWPLDVADAGSIRSFAAHARKAWPAIHALVNNAGVSLSGFDASVARRSIDTNFYGPMRLTDELVDLLASPSNVVMVSSGMGELAGLSPELRGRFADPSLTREELVQLVERFVRDVDQGSFRQSGWPSNAYRVSKVALNALARLMAKDLTPRDVHVNAVCPGWVRTDMGGSSAPRSVERGAEGIVWAATLGRGGPSGGFFRDERAIAW
jgi:NAD(P)-dependent dehydrogenase (short-subunit alcohol dehydrogenase family)